MKTAHPKPNSSNDNTGVLAAVLFAFIPYTKENLMLSYSPGKFFNHLDYLAKQTGANKRTISATISRAKRSGLLQVDKRGQAVTSWRGKIKIGLQPRKKLRHQLIIIFDIPEKKRKQRDLFRLYLRNSKCEQIQKSVWQTKYDIYDELQEVIKDLQIEQNVTLFMADNVKNINK